MILPPHPFPISLSAKKYALRKQHEELVTKVGFLSPPTSLCCFDLGLEISEMSVTYLKLVMA